MKSSNYFALFFLVLFFILFAWLFLPRTVKAQESCQAGFTYCGDSSSCPGTAQCCKLDGAYSGDPCSASGRQCYSAGDCPSQSCTSQTCNPPASNTCAQNECVTAECVSGVCVFGCIAQGQPGCTAPVPSGEQGFPSPSPTPAACNTACTLLSECSPSGLVCDTLPPDPISNSCRAACDLDSSTCSCPVASTCGQITNDNQSGFETGEAFSPVAQGGATLSEGRVNMINAGVPSSGNGGYAEQVQYTAGASFATASTVSTDLPSGVLPVVGQEAYYTGLYYIGSKTGTPLVQACIQWLTAANAVVGTTDCQNLDMTVGGLWKQFQVHSPYRAGADHLRLIFFMTGGAAGNSVTFYIDHLCMLFQAPCAPPGAPTNLTSLPGACGATSQILSWTGPAAASVNVAPNSAVSVSSVFSADYVGTKAVDGIIGVNGSGEWASSGEQNPWIRLTWPSAQTVDTIRLYDRPNLSDSANGGTLTFSDGSSLPVSGIPNDGSMKEVIFAAKTITWVNFQVAGGVGPNVGLSEFQVLGYAAGIFNLYVIPEDVANDPAVTCTCTAPITCSLTGKRCDIYGITTTNYTVTGVSPGVLYYNWGVQSELTCGSSSSYASSTFTINACTGTLRARAHRNNSGLLGLALCADAVANPDEIIGTSFDLTENGSAYGNETQTSAGYVPLPPWTANVGVAYDYTLTSTAPGYAGPTYCYSSSEVGTSIGATQSLTVQNEAGTWDVVYNASDSWLQARDGNIHSNDTGSASISLSTPVGQFLLRANDPVLNNAGLVTYIGVVPGTLAGQLEPARTFLADDGGVTNTQHTQLVPSYYDYYVNRFGSKKVIASGTSVPTSDPNDWYIASGCSGDFTVSGPLGWDITGNRKVVLFIPSPCRLVVGGNITVQNGSSLAFIVGGSPGVTSVTVSGTVGHVTPIAGITAVDKFNDPNVTGIFITDGAFDTGSSALQMIGAGTFVADSFTFNRDLGSNNATAPGELWIYRADLWANAPDELKEIRVKWQEVAP